MAAAKTFGITELLELILVKLPPQDILLAGNTCMRWQAVLEGSVRIRNQLASASLPRPIPFRIVRSKPDPPIRSYPFSSILEYYRTLLRPCERDQYADFKRPDLPWSSSPADVDFGRILVRRLAGKDYFAILSRNPTRRYGDMGSVSLVDQRIRLLRWHSSKAGQWRLEFEDKEAGTHETAELNHRGGRSFKESGSRVHPTAVLTIYNRLDALLGLPKVGRYLGALETSSADVMGGVSGMNCETLMLTQSVRLMVGGTGTKALDGVQQQATTRHFISSTVLSPATRRQVVHDNLPATRQACFDLNGAGAAYRASSQKPYQFPNL